MERMEWKIVFKRSESWGLDVKEMITLIVLDLNFVEAGFWIVEKFLFLMFYVNTLFYFLASL
jgi:hypothetical protein